ncbi:MAG: ABC transporter substrate-binding protein [Planctomycetota bacterium]|jgi:polar amino acid transport system substrate-binding protein
MNALRLLLGPALAALLLASACAPTRPTLVVASDLANPPFAEFDEARGASGRDVEMMAELARRLGRELVWERMEFSALLPAIEAGEVDAVCATLGITAERARRVRFTRPYFETAIAVVVRVGLAEPQTLADLGGRRVAAGSGTTSAFAVQAELPEAIAVLENKSGAATPDRLLSLEVDAAVMDGPNADQIVADSAGRLRRLDEDLDAERYGLVVALEDEELGSALDQALADLEREGFLLQLDVKYGLRGAAGR